MTTYTSPFTGQTINPSDIGYESLTISTNTALQWPINGNNGSVVANIMSVTATTTGLQLANALATTYGGTGLTTVGTNGQVLTSNGTTAAWAASSGVSAGKSIALAMIFGF